MITPEVADKRIAVTKSVHDAIFYETLPCETANQCIARLLREHEEYVVLKANIECDCNDQEGS
jgi:hypothetical protein